MILVQYYHLNFNLAFCRCSTKASFLLQNAVQDTLLYFVFINSYVSLVFYLGRCSLLEKEEPTVVVHSSSEIQPGTQAGLSPIAWG